MLFTHLKRLWHFDVALVLNRKAAARMETAAAGRIDQAGRLARRLPRLRRLVARRAAAGGRRSEGRRGAVSQEHRRAEPEKLEHAGRRYRQNRQRDPAAGLRKAH